MKASFGTTLSWTSLHRSRRSHVPSRPLKLLSSMATREVLAEIAARYRRDTARSVITEAAGGVDVAKRVQAGEAVDAVILASNVEVVGPLPPAIQSITVFSGGISSGCVDPDAARALLRFMASPKVSDIKTRHGMEAA